MSARVVQGSPELGAKIRMRRNELGFTIEEAAVKAGVGTKTWSRYEAGESIRRDKIMSVCKTLNWNMLPNQEESSLEVDLNDYRCSEVWPQALADSLGEAAAISFVIGSDILLDNIEQDLEAIACKPKGTHIGELDISWLKDILPAQFLPEYDYDFLYYLKNVVIRYRNQASSEKCFVARTVIEEIALYVIMKESQFLMESILPYFSSQESDLYDNWDSWPFDLFGDMDVVTCLYSDDYLTRDHIYHFEHWRKEQFYS